MTADDIRRALSEIESETDWAEVRRLAESSAYQNWHNVNELIHVQATTLQVRSPYDPAE
jgi:hypothetical protein